MVAGLDHPEVAVDRVGGVHEERGRAGGVERGRDLLADEGRLPDPRHHDAAAGAVEGAHDGAEGVVDGMPQSRQRLGLDRERAAGGVENQPIV